MIDELIARLKAAVPQLLDVSGVASFQAAVESNPAVTPCCFVIEMDEQPGAPQTANLFVQQRVRSDVGIVLVVRNVADTKGAAARVDMSALRQLVKEQVFGWQAQPAFDPFERGPGHLLAFKPGGYMWWQDIYRTSYIDRSN